MTSVSDPLVGQVLDGRYEILARLARGGMATVYRASDLRLTRTVAVKVMHEGLGEDTDFAKKFDHEARAAATLSSPHVVSVFDQGIDRGRPYIVMEFVDGSTLRHVVSREAPMEPLRALELVESVVNALAAAHDAGLVHRDVKPENVLISSRGQVKVADFGLARAVTAQTATATQGLLIGTVSYMPPELVTKARADARGDVYSTGVMLFEMLTGQKPHQADTPIAVAWSHVHNDIPAPSTLLARSNDSRRIITPYLDALVVACTRRQPAERPRDARELLGLVREARRALRKGIMDDPALTEAMLASTRHRHRGTDPTVPDPATAAPGVQPGAAQHPGQLNGTQLNGAHLSGTDFRGTGFAGAELSATGVQQLAQPPAPVSPHPQHSGRLPSSAGGSSGVSAHTGGSIRMRARTPSSPVDAAAPGYGADFRIDRRNDSDFPVPAPRTASSVARPPSPNRPRSPRTPIFPQISHDPVHKRRRGLVALIAVLILALALGLFAYLYLTKLRWTTAPTLGNLSVEQATTVAQSNGFTVTRTTDYSENVAKGVVISADPDAGARALKGSVITLLVSLGPERYAMPAVVGLSLADARSAIAGAHATTGTVTQQWDEKVASGLVISAGAKTGDPLKPGSKVDLVVSKGPQPIPITSWVGKPADEATTALQKVGFTVTSTQTNSDTVPKGSVISQSPSSGNGTKQTTIALVISKGPVMVQVPSVLGVDESTARQRLTNQNFTVKVVYNTPQWLRLNLVAAQTPNAKGSAPKGSTVTIYIS